MLGVAQNRVVSTVHMTNFEVDDSKSMMYQASVELPAMSQLFNLQDSLR